MNQPMICLMRAYEFWKNAYVKSRGAQTITAPLNNKNTASNTIMRKLGFNNVGESKFKKMGTHMIMK
jgi:RimJ/RimL family protein N-acetyltransferase